MKFLMFPLIAVFMFSCSSTSIDTDKIKLVVAEKVADATAVALECNRPDLIKEDVLGLLKYQGANQELDEKSLGGTLCKMAVSNVLPLLVKTGVPDKWECELSNVNNLIDFVGEKACGLIP